MLIGRKKEIEELRRLFASDKSELIAVYGRRRVGKTFLVLETFKDEMVFFHTGLQPVPNDQIFPEDKLKRQLEKFQIDLVKYGLADDLDAPKDWLMAFHKLGDALTKKYQNKRIVLFLDELPWMDSPKSYFLEAFSDFWNSYCVPHKNIVLVVSGSSSSWMLNNIIHTSGGLSNRVTYPLRLLPFDLSEVEELLHAKNINYSRYEIAETYMMVGGIPFYLDLFNPIYSLDQNIDALFFGASAKLLNEFKDLFNSQFVEPEKYKRIVEILSENNSGYTAIEIANKMGIKSKNGNFYEMIDALKEGGFIIDYVPFKGNKRQVKYKLIDPFCLFYLKQVRGHEQYDNYWRINSSKQKAVTWRGFAFENLCYIHINQIKKAMSILGIESKHYMWYQKGDEVKKGAQIDLVIERSDNVVNLCEMKFYSNNYSINKEDHLNLMNKIESLRENINRRSHIQTVLITSFALTNNGYRGDFQIVLTLDDLF